MKKIDLFLLFRHNFVFFLHKSDPPKKNRQEKSSLFYYKLARIFCQTFANGTDGDEG